MPKFIRKPFAENGDKQAVPDDAQVTDEVSYEEGYTTDYELEQGVDPNAKDIERLKYNQVLFDISENTRVWQTFGFYPRITQAQNGGVVFEYAQYAICVSTVDGMIYESTVNNNATSPPGATWSKVSNFKRIEDLITLTGLPENSVNFGSFTGNTIPNSSLLKPALQALETKAEEVIGTSRLANGSVTNAKLASLAVTNDKIANDTITGAKIAASAISASELAANSVTSGKIANDAVITAKIAVDAVTNSKIATNAVNIDSIAANAVGTSELVNDAVTNSKIATNAVNADSITANAVGASELQTDAVTSSKIAANAVGNSEIATNAVNADSITANAVGASELATNAVTTAKIADGQVSKVKLSAAVQTEITDNTNHRNAVAAYILTEGSNANGSYRTWSDGTIEQWGEVVGPGNNTTVTLPISFGVTTYKLLFTQEIDSSSGSITSNHVRERLSSSFRMRGNGNTCMWYAIL